MKANLNRQSKLFSLVILIVAVSGVALSEPFGTDWPQWRGPNRDGVSTETGLLKTWPASGPAVLWRLPIGTGFSGVAVANGRLVTMDANKGEEFVICIDAATGKEVWRFKSDAAFGSQFGDGPRATPTIDGDMVFTLGGNGMFYAFSLKEGKPVWQHNMREEFKAVVPQHGVASSPIIEDEVIMVNAGGADNHAFIGFNKTTGKLAWASHFDNPDYSAPIAITVDGVRQVVFFTGSSLVSVSPKDGQIFWRYPFPPQFFNAATPVFVSPNKIFVSTGGEKGAALLEIVTVDGKPSVKLVWESKILRNEFSSSVLQGNYLYGFDSSAILKCVDVFSQEEKWATRGFQNGTLILADGHLIVLGERGKVALVEATPTAYKEVASAQVLRGRCWTIPALSNGKLYLRNQKELVCVDLAQKN